MFSMLLIEDSSAVAKVVAESLRRSVSIPVDLYVAADGNAALAFLRCADAPRPNLIVLDWHLPGMHGRDVLEELQADPGLSAIPVVVLTASEDENDLVEAYGLGAHRFITRPSDVAVLEHTLRNMVEFWASVAATSSSAD